MPGKYRTLIVGLLGALLVFQLVRLLRPPVTRAVPIASGPQIGDSIPAVEFVAMSGPSKGSRIAFNEHADGDCDVVIFVDSDCAGCRIALKTWARDSSWRAQRERLRWVVLRSTDTVAVNEITRFDVDARVVSLERPQDMFQLGITFWPAAMAVRQGKLLTGRPAPFPADVIPQLTSGCSQRS